MRRAFAIVALFLAFTPSAAGQAASCNMRVAGSEGDEGAIRKVLADFVGAWNRHDAGAFSMLFAEDADFTNVRGTSARGRAAVERHHAPLFAGRFKDTHLKITEIKIRFIRQDVAAADARWEMVGAKNSEGGDIPLRRGLLNFVMTRDNGKWLVTVMHNMDLPPPQ